MEKPALRAQSVRLSGQIACILSLFTATACSQHYDIAIDKPQAQLDAPGGTPGPNGKPSGKPGGGGGGPNTPVSATLNFTEPNVVTKQLDVLFVIHATGSFNSQLSTNVSNGLNGFISSLGADVDYQLSVVLAYPSGSQSGILFTATPGGNPVLASATMTAAAIQSSLSDTLSKVPTANLPFPLPGSNTMVTSHGEFGTLAVLNALQPANLASIRTNNKFFRPGAALAVIFAANESDNCFIDPTDGDMSEQQWKQQFCEGITAQAVINSVQSAQAGSPSVFGFIGYATDPLDSGGHTIDEEEEGRGYTDIAKATNGVIVNLDPGDTIASASQQASIIASGLQGIGALAKSKFMLTKTFQLNAVPDASSIHVSINGVVQSAGWSYDSVGYTVTIPGVSSLDKVRINYSYLAP